MEEYKFERNPANGKLHSMSRAPTWGAIGLFVVVAILLFTTNLSERLGVNSDLAGLLFAATILGATVGAGILVCREALHYAKRQMVYVLNDDEIVRKRRGYPELRIAFSEVGSLSEEMGWLIIKSADQRTKIAVPKNMIGYDAIRAELVRHHPLSPPVRFKWRGTAILLLCILSWAAVMMFREIAVTIPAGAVALLTLAIGSRRLWLLSHARNRFLLWSSLVFMWCAAILLIYLRAVGH